MCGLVAFFNNKPIAASVRQRALDLACERMRARGPDGEGFWMDDQAAFGHRRLAILDLDPRAAQPMHSICDRYAIVFNGEIYNYKNLRDELKAQGVVFRTTSDTEVILALFAREGENMLSRLHGMFALVIWDKISGKAFVARDPYGIKPLYIGTAADGVLLASQVKALMATGLISREPDLQGQAGFWMLGSVPEPHTWYRDIKAVQAGHCLWIENGKVISSRCWQDIGDVWRNARKSPADKTEIHEQVRAALSESVQRHLVADVPVGIFLSGGIDSGALAALMVECGAQQLEGITITYDEVSGMREDEAPVAARIAQYYGLKRHHIRRVTREEFLQDLPRIIDAMDQPSVDGVNTWYASKAVAELGLKVVVSGVGGDELFFGYESFTQLPRLVKIWRSLAHLPGVMLAAKPAAQLLAARKGNLRWRFAPEWARSIAGAWWLRRSVNSPDDLPQLMGSENSKIALRDFVAEERVFAMTGKLPSDLKLALAQIESMSYLRNQLLRDSDWASMDHSVELRTPLVDFHLLETLQHLLPRLADLPGKILLAEAPAKHLPREIIERRKTGFGIPMGQWLLGEDALSGAHISRYWAKEIVAHYNKSAP